MYLWFAGPLNFRKWYLVFAMSLDWLGGLPGHPVWGREQASW